MSEKETNDPKDNQSNSQEGREKVIETLCAFMI